jgi:hypothetical protein
MNGLVGWAIREINWQIVKNLWFLIRLQVSGFLEWLKRKFV